MRKITTAVTAAALALSMLALAVPAGAVSGYDSAYASESAFLNFTPGQTQSFQVIFVNTGTTTWTRGTASQVDLAACLDDKTTCNSQDSAEAAWNNSQWISAVRYATTTQTSVAPGSFATFSYNVTAPTTAAAGTYRFNGDLVLSTTGEKIHPEGYYQDATITAGGAASALDVEPEFQFRQIGQNASLTISTTNTTGAAGSVSWTCNVVTDPLLGNQSSVNPALTFSGTTDATGKSTLTYTRPNPDTDQVTCYVNQNPIARDTVQVQFGLASQVLSLGPDTAETNSANGTDCRTYTITVLDPASGAAVVGAVVTISYVETNVPAGVTRNPAGPNYTTGAGGTATFDLCSTVAATATPKATYTNAGITYTDNGGTKTFATPVATTAALSPASATNAPSSDTTTASANDNSFGEETYTLAITDQFGSASTVAGTTTFTVTASGGTVYIVACGGSSATTTIGAGSSSSACVTAAAPHSITIDSATPGAAATISASFAPATGSAITSNTATKTWVTTVFTAAPTTGSVTGTVSFVDKRSAGCTGSTAANPAGFYGLTSGSVTYLIGYYDAQSFAVSVAANCDQFETALSSGDVIVYSPAAAPNHNMTSNAP